MGFCKEAHQHHSTHENEVSNCGFILTCQSDQFPQLTTTTTEAFQLTHVLLVLYTHMTSGEQNRDEEPVEVHTPFVTEHHSLVFILHWTCIPCTLTILWVLSQLFLDLHFILVTCDINIVVKIGSMFGFSCMQNGHPVACIMYLVIMQVFFLSALHTVFDVNTWCAQYSLRCPEHTLVNGVQPYIQCTAHTIMGVQSTPASANLDTVLKVCYEHQLGVPGGTVEANQIRCAKTTA